MALYSYGYTSDQTKVCAGKTVAFFKADVGKSVQIVQGEVSLDGVKRTVEWHNGKYGKYADGPAKIESVVKAPKGRVKLSNEHEFENPETDLCPWLESATHAFIACLDDPKPDADLNRYFGMCVFLAV